jgi:Putative peptidoglycan binding domain
MSLEFAGIRRTRWGAVCALIVTCASIPAASARQQAANGDSAADKPATKTSTQKQQATAKSTASATKHSSRRKKKSARARGQEKIDSERARTIQEALIREHYLNGEATGTWNEASEDAMRRYQGDHGWQTKEVPDSRALIKLGLGPSKDHLLNPESAMTAGVDAPRSGSALPTSHTDPPVSPAPAQSPTQSDSPSPQ